MKTYAFRFLPCLGLLALLAGCQPRGEVAVSGQVFIVSPSGESLRLGSVRVQFFDEEEIRAHVKKREQDISNRRESLREELAALEDLTREQAATIRGAEEAYDEREAEIREELTAFVGIVEERASAIERQIVSNAAFIDSMDSLPPPPVGVPTRDEFDEYDKRRRIWLSMNGAERTAWAEALASLNFDLKADVEALADAREKKVFAFADELQALDAVAEAARKNAGETNEKIASITRELARPLDLSDYLVDLPAPRQEVRTDADGEFSVGLAPRRRHVVLAQAQRLFGGEDVEFKWFVRTGETGSRILLSNHNLATSETPENAIHFPAGTGESNT